jgi:cytoskeletal protein RodZ
MYETVRLAHMRRLLPLIVWVLMVIILVWLLAWLLFFRSPAGVTKRNPASDKHTAQSGSGTSKPKTTPTTSGGSNSKDQKNTPAELANAGAGNIFIPFVAATFVGSTLYYVRLRRKIPA